MPSDEYKDLLDRDLSKAAAKDQIDVACPLLRKLVEPRDERLRQVLPRAR